MHFCAEFYKSALLLGKKRTAYQQPSSRLRAMELIEGHALPYENPRMSAVAVGYLDGNTFAEKLDRARGSQAKARDHSYFAAWLIRSSSIATIPSRARYWGNWPQTPVMGIA